MCIQGVKSSKKGFSLPIAIIITTVLIILSASLIFIASSSITNTSSDVNSRQAYLNVKSALEYAKDYYLQSNISIASGTTEYMAMKDEAGGTVTEGAEVSSNEADATKKTTYVVAERKAGTGSAKDTLKLTAYSKYSSAFGNNRSGMARLSVTYEIGNGGSETRRITDPSIPPSAGPASYSNTITLNAKQAPGQNWPLAYYVWTFKDAANAYSGANENSSYGYNPNVSKMNTNESNANIRYPAGTWVGDGSSDKIGPPALFSANSGGGWQSSTFYPDKDNVNYFNLIFAKKGAVLNKNGTVLTDDTQTCEMFHLWYLDPSDKNIYFEFLKPHTKYVTGWKWNGSEELEDTVLVYVKNPKTTVHFKIKGIDDNNVTPTISAPKINSVTVNGSPLSGDSNLGQSSKAVNNMSMTYEGCGWWVANIETADSFKMEVTYQGTTKTVSVTPNSDNEAWVYADTINDTIQSRLSEKNANIALGVSSDSYVTIHAKAKDTSQKSQPLLNYMDVKLNSSTGKINLLNKIIEGSQYSSENYTDSSFNGLATALTNATTAYNNPNFISGQPGATSAEKISKADAEYQILIDAINTAINNLVEKACDPATVNQLKELVKQGDDAVTAQNDSGKYDASAFATFEADTGAYKQAKTLLSSTNLTGVTVNNSITALTAALDTLNNNILNRDSLNDTITIANNLVNDTNYEKSYRNALSAEISNAQAAYNTKQTSQSALDSAQSALQEKIDAVTQHPVTQLNLIALNSAIISANELLSVKMNCTDNSYNALKAARDNAENQKIKAKTQAEIDNLTNSLNTAINNFEIIKPSDTNDKLDHEKKITVWFSGFENKTFTLNEFITTTGGTTSVAGSQIEKDVASGLYYYTVDKQLFNKINVVVSENGKEYQSNEISINNISDNNLAVEFNKLNSNDNTCDIVAKKLTTLYIQKTTPSGSSDIPLVQVDGTPVTVVTSGSYYVVKFVSDSDQSVSINTKSDGSGTKVNNFKPAAGQWIVQYKTNKTVELINVKSVYPKYGSTTASGAKGYTISNAEIDYKNIISPTILSNVTDGYSLMLMGSRTVVEPVEISVPSGKTAVLVDVTGTAAAADGVIPYGYLWKRLANNSDYAISTSFPGSPLLRYKDTNYYYQIVDSDVYGLIVTVNGNKIGGSSGQDGHDIIINPQRKNTKYIIVKGNNFNNIQNTDTAPTISTTVHDADVGDMTATDVKMAFVGGNKVRVTNRSYALDYPDGQKYNQNHNQYATIHRSGNMFGGSDGNKGSMNRVGNSQLNPFYDWYEFKIPVDKLASYTCEIKGMNVNESSVLTKQLSDVYGDIWLTLDGTDKDNGRYSNVGIYTFDPEKNQMEYAINSSGNTSDKTRIYFNVPSGWSNVKATASGIGNETVDLTNKMGDYGAGSATTNYCYADINAKNPFITFTARKSDGTLYQCRTSLCGGDTVLFDPTFNGGYGGWDDYVSPQTLLKREVLKAQTNYYGSLIVNKYDDNGYVVNNGANTYEYPNNLQNQYNPYISADGNGNKTINFGTIYNSTNSVAYNNYKELHSWVNAYENLYAAMSSAKAFIEKPTNGGKYPEFLNRNNNQSYETSSITNLKNKLSAAESAYTNGSSSIDALNKNTLALKTAISGITVTSEGSITAIMCDVQDLAKNGNVQIKYTPDGYLSSIVENVTQRNPEGYPIIRIRYTHVTDVKFIVDGTERDSKPEMNENETWVFMDSPSNPYWVQNTTCDYIQINNTNFEQSASGDKCEYKMKKDPTDTTKYRSTVLYFKYDTEVKLADGSAYNIMAGAYLFTDTDTQNSDSPFNGGTLDLYSNNSKTYFTTSKNYGKLDGATDASTVGWVDSSSGKLSNLSSTITVPVNFEASSGTVKTPVKFSTVDKMYFRWKGNSDMIVNADFALAAKEYTFASSGAIDASKVYGNHFYLKGVGTEDKVNISFKSDVTVKYLDSTGITHSFVIHEGDYSIKKATASQNFIADLFDESYWKSDNVTVINGDGSSGSGDGILQNPIYSTNG